MQSYTSAKNQEITEKGLENLRRNAELRKKDSKFVRLQPGEKAILCFNPEKIEPVESEFNGKKALRYQYGVTDPNLPDHEKYFTVGKRTSEIIDTHLAERRYILAIQRIGAGIETQYVIVPAA